MRTILATVGIGVLLSQAAEVGAEETQKPPATRPPATRAMSVDEAIGVANACVDLGLSREEMLAASSIARSLTRRLGDPRIEESDEAVRIRNAMIRDSLRGILGDGRVKRHNEAVVQYFLSEQRPVLAFDWLEIELTDEQRDGLRKIELSEAMPIQLMKDRIQVVMESLAPVASLRRLEVAIGEPYEFRQATLRNELPDLGSFPDVESVRVLASPYVQAHLQLTTDQVQQVMELASDYHKRDLPPGDEIDGPVYTKSERDQYRKAAIEDTESILTEVQKTRFRQIVAQRYLFSVIPDYALRYLEIDETGGDRKERYHQRRNVLGAELAMVRRLRVNEEMRIQVGEIVGQEFVDQLMGKPAVFRSMRQHPKLDNSVARSLLRKWDKRESVNPRRSDRSR